jgi:hypothetical protein
MENASENGRNWISDDDLRVLIGILANVEMALMVEESDQVMPKLLERVRRDCAKFQQPKTGDAPSDFEAVRAMNYRLRLALGETLPGSEG